MTTQPHTPEGNGEPESSGFEKVSSEYATVNDLLEDTMIKIQTAARASALFNAVIKRAKGDLNVRLRDIAD